MWTVLFDLNLKHMEEKISSSFSQIQEIMFSLTYNDKVQKYLLEKNAYARYELDQWMRFTVMGYNHLRKDIYDIGFLTQDNMFYYISQSSSIFRGMRENGILENDKPLTCGIVQDASSTVDKWYVYFSSPIYSILSNEVSKKIGAIIVIVEADSLKKYIQSFKISKNTKVYLVNNDDFIVSSTENGDILKKFTHKELYSLKNVNAVVDGTLYIIYSSGIEKFGWNMVTMVPYDDIYGPITSTRNTNAAIIAAGLLFMLAFTLFIRSKINHPIRRILSELKKVEKGDLDFRLSEIKHNEISTIAKAVNAMLDEVERLTGNMISSRNNLYKAEIEKKHTELMFLHSQINPHFLYNTLEGISSIAAFYNVREIEQIAISLAGLSAFPSRGTIILPLPGNWKC